MLSFVFVEEVDLLLFCHNAPKGYCNIIIDDNVVIVENDNHLFDVIDFIFKYHII